METHQVAVVDVEGVDITVSLTSFGPSWEKKRTSILQ